jgi:hypothetical protein
VLVRRTDRSCAEILWALFVFPMPTGGYEKERGLLDKLHIGCVGSEWTSRSATSFAEAQAARPDATFCRDRTS